MLQIYKAGNEEKRDALIKNSKISITQEYSLNWLGSKIVDWPTKTC